MVDSYTFREVASTPTPTTTASHSSTPASPSPSIPVNLCGAPANPFGYNFCGTGATITSPPGYVCSYFDCASDFSSGAGYLVECVDTLYTLTGGTTDCAGYGGDLQTVYAAS